MNDITLNRRKISRFLGKQSMKVERGKSYSKEQIVKILTVCEERTRAIVLLLASTGLRVGAIPELKRKHFTPLENDISMISIYEGEYFTLLWRTRSSLELEQTHRPLLLCL
jgi:integrase